MAQTSAFSLIDELERRVAMPITIPPVTARPGAPASIEDELERRIQMPTTAAPPPESLLSTIAPALPQGVRQGVQLAERLPVVRDVARGAIAGTAGLLESGAGLAHAAMSGLAADAPPPVRASLTGPTADLLTLAQDTRAVLTPEVLKRPLTEEWTNPQWWATAGGTALPSIAALAAGGKIPAAIGESLLEGGSAYSEAVRAGASPAVAGAAAAKVIAANLPLLLATNAPLFDPLTRSRVANVGIGATSEAAQESAQTVAGNVAARAYDPDRALLEGVPESAAVGGLVGGGVRGLTEVRQPASRPPAAAPPAPGGVDAGLIDALERRIAAPVAAPAPTPAADPLVGELETRVAQDVTPAPPPADATLIGELETRVNTPIESPAPTTAAAAPTITAESLVTAPTPKTFAELPALERRELRRMLTELDEIRHSRTQTGEEMERVGDATQAAEIDDARQRREGNLLKQTPNAPVYHGINAGKKRTGRQIREALQKFIDGTGRPSAIVQDAVRVARERAYVDAKAYDPQFSIDDFSAPGELYVTPRRLGREGADVEQQTIAKATQDPRALLDGYRARFGNVINADNMSELLDVHTPAKRWQHHDAVRSTAAALTEAAYQEALAEPVTEANDVVVLTGGGTGSGKSTTSTHPGLTLDTTLSDFNASKRNIDRALASGRFVEIQFTYRDPIEAYVQGVLPRAADPAHGRPVSAFTHASTHVNAPQTLLQLAEAYADEPQVGIAIKDNTAGGGNEARDLEWLRAQAERYTDVDVLRAQLTEAGRTAAPAAGREGTRESGQREVAGRRESHLGPIVGRGRGKADGPAALPQTVRLGPLEYARAAPAASPESLYLPATRGTLPIVSRKAERPLSEPEVVTRLQQVFAQPQRASGLDRMLGRTPTRPLPVQTGRHTLLNRRALGLYFDKPAIIRLKRHGDLSVFTHELGHHIDIGMFDRVGRPSGLFKRELLTLGARTSPPGASLDYRLKEGVAEYFRAYLADRTSAAAAAPAFTDALDAVLADAPVFAAQLKEASGLVQRYLRQSAETRGRARVNVAPGSGRGRGVDVLAELKSNPERGRLSRRLYYALHDTGNLPAAFHDFRTWWDTQITRHVDRHRAIWRAVQDYAPELPASLNAYTLTRLADKAPAIAEGFLAVGPRGANGRFLGASLQAALRPIHDRLAPTSPTDDRPNLVTYLVALRALELHHEGKGRDPGVRPEEAVAIVEATSADPDFQKFEDARENVRSFLKGLREYAVEYGAMSEAQAATLDEAIFYIPLQRVGKADVDVQPGAATYADRQSPLKRLVGSGRDIIDPIESLVKNTFALTAFVERNRAALALVDTLRQVTGAGTLLQEISTPQERTKFNLDKVADDVWTAIESANLVDPDQLAEARKSGELDDVFNQLVTIYTPTTVGRPGEQILFVMDAGKQRFFQIQDPALYANLVGLGPGATNHLMVLGGKAASILRAGVTLRPSFVVRNLIRDTVGAFFQSRHGFLPGYDTVRGLIGQFKNDEDYQRLLSFGIQQATLLGNDRNKLKTAVNDALRPRRWPSKLFKPITNPVQFLQEWSAAIETATRLGEFKLALDTGGKERRAGVLGLVQRAKDVGKARPALTEDALTAAALAAADVTVDFSRGGVWAKNISTVSTFYNARVQGNVRAIETIRRDPVGTALNVAALTTLSALLWWWNHDDEEYQEIDERSRRDYWFIRLPGTDHWLTVPKPFVWSGAANFVELSLDETERSTPEALHPLREFAHGAGRDVILTITPTIVMPTLEAYANWSFYRDRPIVSPWLRGKEPDLQVSDWTSDTFRVLGQAVGVSPAILEHWARATAGGAVSDVAMTTDPLAQRVVGGRGKPEGPARGVDAVPGLQALLRPKRIDSRSRSVETFYRRWEDLEQARTSLKAYREGAGLTDAAAYERRIAEQYPPGFAGRMKAAKDRIDAARDELDAVMGGRLSADEKRRRVDRLHAQIAELARWGLEGTVQ